MIFSWIIFEHQAKKSTSVFSNQRALKQAKKLNWATKKGKKCPLCSVFVNWIKSQGSEPLTWSDRCSGWLPSWGWEASDENDSRRNENQFPWNKSFKADKAARKKTEISFVHSASVLNLGPTFHRSSWFRLASLEFKKPYGHISLKVPNVEFNFDVSVGSMQLLTHTSKT